MVKLGRLAVKCYSGASHFRHGCDLGDEGEVYEIVNQVNLVDSLEVTGELSKKRMKFSLETRANQLLMQNDILITSKFGEPAAAYLDKSPQTWTISGQNLFCIRLENPEKAPYVTAYLKSPAGVRQLLAISRPAAQRNKKVATMRYITLDDLRSINIPNPSPQEQEKLVELYLNIGKATSLFWKYAESLDVY